MLRELGSDARCDGGCTLDDLGNALGYVCLTDIDTGGFLRGVNERRDDMRRDLCIGFYEGRHERQHRLEAGSHKQRRVRNFADVGEGITLNLGKGRCGRKPKHESKKGERL